MIINLSWQSYWTVIAIILAVYYLTIYLLYFQSELRLWLHKRSSILGNSQHVPDHSEKRFNPSSPSEGLPFSSGPGENSQETIAHACKNELNAYFEKAESDLCDKEDISHSLQSILKKFRGLRPGLHQETLIEFIVAQSRNVCSIHLSVEEVEVWFAK